MLNFKKMFIWHLSNSHWEAAMDKVYAISKSFGNIHQRFLDKRNISKNPTKRRFRDRKDSGMDK